VEAEPRSDQPAAADRDSAPIDEALLADTLARTQRRVAEVLALDTDEVAPSSRLLDDLGAESLDLVELMYLLEQEFELRLSRDDLSLSAQLGLDDEQLHEDGVLTPKALELLRQRFPQARGLLVEGITRKHLAALLTVEEVARAVARKRASSQD
jgi:acyl carrier protein